MVHVYMCSADFGLSEGLRRRLTDDRAPQLRGNRRKWYELHIAPNNIFISLAQY